MFRVLLAENKLTTQRSTQDSAREEEEKEDKLPRLQGRTPGEGGQATQITR